MSARTGAGAAARKGFAVAIEELEGVVARRLLAAQPAGTAQAALTAKIAELEAALVRAERERDTARAALGALRAARAEDARLVDDALKDLREVV